MYKSKEEDFVVYSTTESLGQDIAIKDSCGRYALIHEENLDELILALVKIGIDRRGEYPAATPFEEIVP